MENNVMKTTNVKEKEVTATPIITEPVMDATTEEIKTTAKKKTAPKKKSREITELVELAVKNMTDKEKENLINYLKDEGYAKDGKITALKNNCEMAYEKLRRCEEEYNAMERYYKDRLNFIDQQVLAFSNAVKLSIVGGVN